MKRMTWMVLAALLFLLCACGAEAEPAQMPSDFSFSLIWGVSGISSYDMETGELVKSYVEPEAEKYRTTLTLNEEQRAAAWAAAASLDWEAYASEDGRYNPNPDIWSCPSMTLILSVRENGRTHQVRCIDIALMHESEDEAGMAFLGACRALEEILTSSAEWQALPEYTVLFE